MPSPSINKAIRYVEPLLLDSVKGASAAYSLRKLTKTATNAIRIRRSDDNSEIAIGFAGKYLDIGAIRSFLERNVATASPLGIDGDANGVSDGWYSSATVTTSTFDINDSAQRITITNASVNNSSANVVLQYITLAATTTYTATVTYRKTGNMKARFVVNYYNSSNSYLSSETVSIGSSETYTTLTVSGTAPTNTAKIEIALGCRADNVGETGSVWYKDLIVTKTNLSAYVTTWYDQVGTNNATQATSGNQPMIVNSGVVSTVNNLPTVEWSFSGASNSMNLLTPSVVAYHICCLAQYADGVEGTWSNGFQGIFGDVSSTVVGLIGTVSGSNQWNPGAYRFLRKNGAAEINTNGQVALPLPLSVLVVRNSVSDTSTISIGSDRQLNGRGWRGYIPEFIVYPTQLDLTNAQKIEKSMSKYYGITLA